MFNIDPILLSTARNLCADSGDLNPEYVRGCAEIVIDMSYGLNQNDHKDTLIKFLGGPLVDPNGPLTSDQRRALFSAFTDVFGDSDNERRYAFTRLALCKSADEPVSWSAHGQGGLTYTEASQVLDALDMLSV